MEGDLEHSSGKNICS